MFFREICASCGFTLSGLNGYGVESCLYCRTSVLNCQANPAVFRGIRINPHGRVPHHFFAPPMSPCRSLFSPPAMRTKAHRRPKGYNSVTPSVTPRAQREQRRKVNFCVFCHASVLSGVAIGANLGMIFCGICVICGFSLPGLNRYPCRPRQKLVYFPRRKAAASPTRMPSHFHPSAITAQPWQRIHRVHRLAQKTQNCSLRHLPSFASLR